MNLATGFTSPHCHNIWSSAVQKSIAKSLVDFIEFLAFILFQTQCCRAELVFFFQYLTFCSFPFREGRAGKILCGRRDCQSCISFIAKRLFQEVDVASFSAPQETFPAAGAISADPCLTCCSHKASRVLMNWLIQEPALVINLCRVNCVLSMLLGYSQWPLGRWGTKLEECITVTTLVASWNIDRPETLFGLKGQD